MFSHAIRKYGVGSFKIEIIEFCESLTELNEREIFWIKKLDATNRGVGYNQTNGGNKPPVMHGIENPMFGKKRPDLSERNKKTKYEYTNERRNKLSEHRLGKTLSESTKNKMSISGKIVATNRPPELLEKMRLAVSNARKGKTMGNTKVQCIQTGIEYLSISHAAADLNCGRTNICRHLRGEHRHVKGYTFIKI